MANSSYIALIKCAHCGNENATVHQQQTGTKKGRLYYRCYSEINGAVMLCGTIQCIGQSGQKYINDNMRPIGQNVADLFPRLAIDQIKPPELTPEPPELTPEPPEPEIEPIALPVLDAVPVVRRSVLEFLING